MIVCHCFRISDREIKLTISLGVTDIDEVGYSCGAGMGCGGCRGTIAKLLDDAAKKVEKGKSKHKD